jgi:preprotein translocase subunit SecB
MDRSKQPGISFDGIILKELVFIRREGYPDARQLNAHWEASASFSQEGDRLVYEMVCEIKGEEEFFSVRCAMIGFFSVMEGQENMSLKEYSNLSAPAAILPYIREAIASTTTRAGIPPVIIPPVNLSLLIQKSNFGEG